MDSEHVFEQLMAQSLESCCILLNVGLYGSLNTFCHEIADFEIYTYIITQIAKCISGLSFYVCSHRLMHTHKKIKNAVFGFVPSANTGVLQTGSRQMDRRKRTQMKQRE